MEAQRSSHSQESITGIQLPVRAVKVIAGLESAETNLLLQTIATALDKKLDSSQYVAELTSDKKTKNQTNAQLTEKKAKHEKSKDKPEKSKDKPEKSKDKPEKSKDKPEKSKDKPEKSKDKPEKKEEKKKTSTTTTQNTGGITDRSKKTKVLASRGSVESVRKEEVKVKSKPKKVKEKLITPKENKSNTGNEKNDKKLIETKKNNVHDLIEKASTDALKEELKKIDVEPLDFDNEKPEKNDNHETELINYQTITEAMPEGYSTNEQPDNVPVYNDVVPPIRLNSARPNRNEDEEIVKPSKTIDEEIVKTSRTIDEEIVKTSRTIDGEIPEPAVIKDTRMERIKSARPRTGKRATTIDKENTQPIQLQAMETQNNNVERPIRPRSSLRPPSVRPSSARPGAPRLRSEASLPEGEIVPLGKVNVIIESFNNKDLDEEETVTIQTAPEPEYQIPITNLQLPTDKGHLVEQILEQIQQSDVVEHSKPTVNIEWEQDGFRSRNAANKEIEQLKAAIQTLTRTANPLGKLVNYLHEDIEAMHTELEMWVNSARQIMVDVANQKRISDESNKPLQVQLEEIEENIVKHQQQIVSVHGNILRNEQRIRDLLVK